MKTFLNNLLPRLREHSQTLDKKELLVDQPWVLVDDDGNKQQYIFERDGNLIMSLNGDTKYGKWRYIPAAKSLLIDRESDSLLLNHAFFTKGVCILKKDGFIDQPWMLVNQNVVPDLNIERYLNALLPENKPFRELAVVSEEPIFFNKEELDQKGTIIGVTLKNREGSLINTTFKRENRDIYLVVKNNVVVRQYMFERMKTNRGDLKVEREVNSSIIVGCVVYDDQGKPANGKYDVLDNDVKSLTIQDGKVVKVDDTDSITVDYMFKILVAVVLVIVAVILFKLYS